MVMKVVFQLQYKSYFVVVSLSNQKVGSFVVGVSGWISVGSLNFVLINLV